MHGKRGGSVDPVARLRGGRRRRGTVRDVVDVTVGFDGDADAVVVALRPRAVALDGANVVALVVEQAPRADVLAELFVVEARGAAGGCVVGAAEQPRGRRVGRDGGLVAHGESEEGEGEEGLHMILFGCCGGGGGGKERIRTGKPRPFP